MVEAFIEWNTFFLKGEDFLRIFTVAQYDYAVITRASVVVIDPPSIVVEMESEECEKICNALSNRIAELGQEIVVLKGELNSVQWDRTGPEGPDLAETEATLKGAESQLRVLGELVSEAETLEKKRVAAEFGLKRIELVQEKIAECRARITHWKTA